MQQRMDAASYLGVPLELSDGTRVGALAALSREYCAFEPADEQLFVMLARVLASELERESNERDLRRFNDMLRDQARGMGAVGRVAKALAAGEDARAAVCEAACEVAGAPVAFLLEPSGRDFTSTAMAGAEIAPVTIQPRGDDDRPRPRVHRQGDLLRRRRPHAPGARRAARGGHGGPLRRVRAGAARRRRGRRADRDLARAAGGAAGRARRRAAAAGRPGRGRDRARGRCASASPGLSFTDPLTGLATRRMWDEELPRELARTRRSESPLTIAALDIDHMSAFNMLRGEREGDRLIKECGSRWRNELREVDFLARIDGTEFAIILPGCGLGEACDVLDRVREATPRGQTASAGVARWDGEEPAELFLARAQDALAAAKSAGRNVTIAAD